MRRVLLLGAIVAAAAGVATGVVFAVRGGTSLSPADARTQFAKFEAQWRSDLRTGARADPSRRFPSPSLGWLKGRLRDAEALCNCFTVLEVKLLHPLQTAPLIVVEAKDEHAFVARQWAIVSLFDQVPPARANRDWAYEGAFLEARNGAGVPFFATDLSIRGAGGGGGGSTLAAPGLLPSLSHP